MAHNKFSKNEPSLYKLTNKQIKQLLNYLKYEINQEELNNAIGYTYNCPYCNSKDIYKTEQQFHLYKFKCQSCKKKFTNLSKSVISELSKEEHINLGNRSDYKKAFDNIEVWLCFDVKYDRRHNTIPRKSNINTIFRWKHNLLHIPKDLKKEHLADIHERDQKSFERLLNIKSSRYKRKIKNKQRFIIVTFQEGEFVSKKSIEDINNQLMKVDNTPLQNYKDTIRAKQEQQKYQDLKYTLIQAYNDDCEILTEPNRKNKVYTNIAIAFKHTYSLVYEMAIRNSNVKKILYAVRYLKNIRYNLQLIKNDMYENHFKKKLLTDFSCYLTNDQHEQYLSIGLYKLNSLIDDFEEELRKQYLIVPKENKIKTIESNRILVQRAIHNSIDPKKYKRYSNQQLEQKYKFEEKVYEEYTITTGIFEGDDEFDVSAIRPTFNLHVIDKNTFYIPVNLTLPTEEITAFIEKLKDDIVKNENIIKSPMELLGEELEKIDSADVEKYLTKSFERKLISMADALFAYDIFQYLSKEQNSLKQKRDLLQNELDKKLAPYNKSGRRTTRQNLKYNQINKKYEPQIEDYNKQINLLGKTVASKHKRIGSILDISNSTIERYISFMDEYIEDEKYKKLFTKTKTTEKNK